MHTTALVLFSGGQDSTTCLAQALAKYERVETVGFDYGQRHSVELQARLVVLQQMRAQFPQWASRLGEDHVLDLAVLGQVSETSLTRDMVFKMEESGLPNTFVPGRNLLFLGFAGALAYRRNLSVLVGGMCETDYSGYPDCRDNTLKAMQLNRMVSTPSKEQLSLDVKEQARIWAQQQAEDKAARASLVSSAKE